MDALTTGADICDRAFHRKSDAIAFRQSDNGQQQTKGDDEFYGCAHKPLNERKPVAKVRIVPERGCLHPRIVQKTAVTFVPMWASALLFCHSRNSLSLGTLPGCR